MTRSNRTKEHVYPDWCHPYEEAHPLYRELNEKFGLTATSIRRHTVSTSNEIPQKGTLHRQGRSLTLAVVCRSCNNGWMSDIQNTVKLTLGPIISGNWRPIKTQDILSVARWCVMTTMVLEFAHIQTMANTQQCRLKFMKTPDAIPGQWYIWIGYIYPGRALTAFNHFGFSTNKYTSEPVSALTPHMQIQSTAFSIGSLFVQTYSVREHTVTEPERFQLVDTFAKVNEVRTLWPTLGRDIDTPARILSDSDADAISTLFVSPDKRHLMRRTWTDFRHLS